MTAPKTDKKEQMWTMLYLIVPVLLLTRLNDNFGDDAPKTLYAGVFGAVGGLIGWGVYNFVKSKTTLVKIIALITLIGICIATLFIAASMTNQTSIE